MVGCKLVHLRLTEIIQILGSTRTLNLTLCGWGGRVLVVLQFRLPLRNVALHDSVGMVRLLVLLCLRRLVWELQEDDWCIFDILLSNVNWINSNLLRSVYLWDHCPRLDGLLIQNLLHHCALLLLTEASCHRMSCNNPVRVSRLASRTRGFEEIILLGVRRNLMF